MSNFVAELTADIRPVTDAVAAIEQFLKGLAHRLHAHKSNPDVIAETAEHLDAQASDVAAAITNPDPAPAEPPVAEPAPVVTPVPGAV